MREVHSSQISWDAMEPKEFYEDVKRNLQEKPFSIFDETYNAHGSSWLSERGIYANLVADNNEILGNIKAVIDTSFSSGGDEMHPYRFKVYVNSRLHHQKLMGEVEKLVKAVIPSQSVEAKV